MGLQSAAHESDKNLYQQLDIKVRAELIRARAQVCSNAEAAASVEDSEITEHTALIELGLDSLKLIEVIFELENAYGVDADEELLAELSKVGDIVKMMHKAISARPVLDSQESANVARTSNPI